MDPKSLPRLFQGINLRAFNKAESALQTSTTKYKLHREALTEARANLAGRESLRETFHKAPTEDLLTEIVWTEVMKQAAPSIFLSMEQDIRALEESEQEQHADLVHAAIKEVREDLGRIERETTLADHKRSQESGDNIISTGAFERIRQAKRNIDDSAIHMWQRHPAAALNQLKSALTQPPQVRQEDPETYETSARA